MFKAHLYKYKHITIYTYNKYAIIIDVKYYLLQYNIFNIIYKTSHIFEYILFIKHELFILMKKIVVFFNDIFFIEPSISLNKRIFVRYIHRVFSPLSFTTSPEICSRSLSFFLTLYFSASLFLFFVRIMFDVIYYPRPNRHDTSIIRISDFHVPTRVRSHEDALARVRNNKPFSP